MARDSFIDVIWLKQSNGTPLILDNINVEVFKLDSSGNREGTLPILYTSRSGGTQKTNPFISTDGSIEFWADAGEYEIEFTDLTVPQRMSKKTIGWMSVPGGPSGIAQNQLPDQGRGLIQAGDIIFCGYEDPGSGYVAAAGQYVTRSAPYDAVFAKLGTAFNLAGDTDGTKFRLPDMRGRAPVGWGSAVVGESSHADVATRGQSDGLNLSSRRPKHSHTGPAHTHTISTEPGHQHRFTWGGRNAGFLALLDPAGNAFAGSPNFLGQSTTSATGQLASLASQAIDVYNYLSEASGSHSHGGATGTSGTGSTGVDGPGYLVSLWKIKL